MKILIALFVLIFTASCQINPVTGDNNVKIISNEQAIQQASTAYYSLLSKYSTSGAIDSDKKINERVNKVFNRLLPQAKKVSHDANSWNWELHVVTNNEPNAWCMAGGKIAVFTGLISRLNATDDELAFLLAHEIGHALGEHTSAKQSMQILTNIALLTYNSQHKNNPQLQQKVQDLSTLLITLPYSRSEENQADKIGLDLATRAGYRPEASISLWEKMIALNLPQNSEFMSTHPSFDTRISNLKTLINSPNSSNSDQETLGLVADDFNKFKRGEAVLNCTVACGFGNGSNRDSIKELYLNHRWKDLAIVVIKVNYEKNLNYFYLGKAAEELGYKDAAKIYYKNAIDLSSTSKRCDFVFKYQCNGIEVLKEAQDGLDRVK